MALVLVRIDHLQKPPVRCFTIVGDKGRIVWHEQRSFYDLRIK